MSQILGFLSGAPQAANQTGQYYQQAANDIYQQYGPSATKYFTAEQNNTLRPQFQQQQQQLAGTEAAQGITHSGAGINAFGNLGAQQAGALSSADAGLFSQGLSGAAGVYGNMPGAQTNSYNNAINQFYQALEDGASAAGGTPPPQPSQNNSGDGANAIWNPYG
jgi:hypothetical protein